MQVSLKWLKDYIDIELSAEELAEKLTMAGIAVENVESVGKGLDKVVTGCLEEVAPHPDSDHLKICQVNVGQKELLQIVTGAPNVKKGQVVPVALVGAHLPNGQKISKGKLRGALSMGMLCSAEELGIILEDEAANQGIYILPENTPVGVKAAEALGLDDAVFTFELTANRGDCFSVWGIVREIAVLTGKVPHFPEIEEEKLAEEPHIKIAIESNLCRRFSACYLENVKIGPSPEWIRERLAGAGIRAINNVVDVTNFVMLELGQPMHAYDYDSVKGASLTAREAIPGERLHTLDDSDRKAKGGELVIADAEKAAGLAGVMGGLETEIRPETKRIVLEAAVFDGASIRRTSRSLGIHTEASGRFERGIDELGTERAICRAVELLTGMGASDKCEGVVDVYPNPGEETKITFTAEEINHRLGTDIPLAVMKDILLPLGFKLHEEKGDRVTVVVPSWRRDVTLMEDISEEIARIYGYDKIPATLPAIFGAGGTEGPLQVFEDKIREILVSLGLYEEISFSFTSQNLLDRINAPKNSELYKAIPIMNPLSEEYPLVRTSLLPGILETASRNFSRKNMDLGLFEIGPVFLPQSLPVEELPREVPKLAILITGRRQDMAWNIAEEEADFFDLKGIGEELFERLGIKKYEVARGEHFALHPGKTAVFKKGQDVFATLGELSPKVAEAFRMRQKVYVLEADILSLYKYKSKKAHIEQEGKYPSISRDLAVVVDEKTAAGDIARTIAKAGGQFFKKSYLFDVWSGEQIGAGKKSLAFGIEFSAKDRTLKDEDADAAMAKILDSLKDSFGAALRS